MNARDYLESLQEDSERIQIKQEQVQRLHESLTALSVPTDKEQVSHTKNVTVLADTVAQIVDMEKEIDQQLELLYQKQRQARAFFSQLKPKYEKILIERYINRKQIEELMDELCFSRTDAFRQIAAAINALQQFLDSQKTWD